MRCLHLALQQQLSRENFDNRKERIGHPDTSVTVTKLVLSNTFKPPNVTFASGFTRRPFCIFCSPGNLSTRFTCNVDPPLK